MIGESEAVPLENLRWKNRVLVVVAPDGDPAAAEQRHIYRRSEKGMSDRAIVLIEALGDGDRARKTRMQLGADGSHFQAYLIGKDGNLAFTSKSPVSAEDLLGGVYAMPMRQQELRRARLVTSIGDTMMGLRIGVISDTHGLLRPEAERCLVGVDHILHGGDIGRPDIIDALRRIAPVTAIRGNVDRGEWAEAFPDTEYVQLGNRSFYLIHDIKTLEIDPAARGIDVVVSGHSHIAKVEMHGRVLYLNPGSAGRRRFKTTITLAILTVTSDDIRPIVHDLGAN